MPKNHSTITCKKGAKILPTFSCIESRASKLKILRKGVYIYFLNSRKGVYIVNMRADPNVSE